MRTTRTRSRNRSRSAGVPLVVWVVRLTLILFIQGLIVLGSYAYYGFGTDPAHFGPGFRLDPIHAAVNLVWGLAGSVIGFFMPRLSISYMLAFAIFFTLFAGFGTFTADHFGMRSTRPTISSTGRWRSPAGASPSTRCGRPAFTRKATAKAALPPAPACPSASPAPRRISPLRAARIDPTMNDVRRDIEGHRRPSGSSTVRH